MPAPDATTLLLIRHAHTDAIGKYLAGRAPGLPLSAPGRVQADRLGRALVSSGLTAIYTSPLERAQETAQALARYQAAPVHAFDALTEVDFGAWTGKRFDELDANPEWQLFNRRRSAAHIPGGETAAAVQERILAALSDFHARHAGRTIAIVSHGDVLRYAVVHYAGSALDLYHRFEISPASVTALSLSSSGPKLLYVNNTTFAGQP